MTDQEINEAVARKLGWTWTCAMSIHPEDAMWNRESVWLKADELPDYCHDIKAAWEVVEKPGMCWQLMSRTNGSWFAALSTNTQAIDYCEATADTAPMAICLAFLKLEGR